MNRPIETDKLTISTAVPVDLDLRAPPPPLAEFVNTYFVIRSDEAVVNEVMPAYSAQFMVYIHGSSQLLGESGEVFESDRVTFTAPLMNAMPVKVTGPLLVAGASLTPLGWQCLAKVPADKLNNCMLPASRIIEPEGISTLEACASLCRDGKAGPEAIFETIGRLLQERRDAIRPDHALFVRQMNDWLSSGLNPDIDDLYGQVAFSPRTAQRLSKRFFGVSPTRLVKRYRAIRAAMLLANPSLPQTMRDEIRNSYFDQAHLIRDIRRYTGRTPTALLDGSIAQETLYPEAHGQGAKMLRPSGQSD